MKTKIRKLFLTGTAVFLLGACTNANEEEATEGTAEAHTENTYEEIHADSSYFVEDMQTTFNPVTTELPTLSSDEEALAKEVSLKLNEASTPKPGEDHEPLSDRGYIETFADDYPEYTVDELTNLHYALGDINMYGGFGERYIASEDFMDLNNSVIQTNLKDPKILDKWSLEGGTLEWNGDYTKSTQVDNYRWNGQKIEVKTVMTFNDDYSEATLVELVVDGEKADLH